MLRKGLVALMISVMSVGANAADEKANSPLMGFLRGPAIGRPQQSQNKDTIAPKGGGVTHAVVEDAEKQVPEIRQTSAKPDSELLEPADSTPQPTPIQYAPVVPNQSAVSGPQYFSATAPNGSTLPVHPGANWQQYSEPTQFAPMQSDGVPVHTVGFNHKGGRGLIGLHHNGGGPYHVPTVVNNVPMGGGSQASLYPSPRPGIPTQVSGTLIPHHALQPHEMLYAHKYKAMYGPYYYKVNGGWMVTPFGVWSKENWKLQGTTVDVKYKSSISPFARFHPPVIR